MNLDDFKSDWKQLHMLPKDRFDELASGVVARTAKLESSIRLRDLIEAAAAMFVLVGFGAFLRIGSFPTIMQIGIVIIMLSAVEIIVVMYWTRHRDDQPETDVPLLEFCRAEIARVDRQIRLLRNVTWWYSGPLLIGLGVFIFGLLCTAATELSALVFYGFFAAFLAAFLAFGVVLYRGSSHSVKTRFIPIRDELAELVRALEDDVPESRDS